MARSYAALCELGLPQGRVARHDLGFIDTERSVDRVVPYISKKSHVLFADDASEFKVAVGEVSGEVVRGDVDLVEVDWSEVGLACRMRWRMRCRVRRQISSGENPKRIHCFDVWTEVLQDPWLTFIYAQRIKSEAP